MQTINFSATNRSRKVNGTLIIRSKNNQIMFETTGQKELAGFVDSKIKTTDIKDPKNFIAAYFSRVDTEAVFKSVKVEDSTVKILRDKPIEETVPMEVFVLGDLENKKVFIDQNIMLTDKNGSQIPIKLSEHFKMVKVPYNFKYVKDPILNSILEYNVVPYNYDRQWNNKILKIVKHNQHVLTGDKPQNIYVNKFFNISFEKSSKAILVIPYSIFNSDKTP